MTWLYVVGLMALLVILIYASVADRNLASIEVDQETVTVTPRGLNKLWTLRPKVAVPIEDVVDVRVVDPKGLPRGLRLPGTAVPGLITAGMYRKSGEWSFFAIRGGRPVVLIETSAAIKRIVVETHEPDEVVRRLEADLADGGGRRETMPSPH